jgi:hypothetical protein
MSHVIQNQKTELRCCDKLDQDNVDAADWQSIRHVYTGIHKKAILSSMPAYLNRFECKIPINFIASGDGCATAHHCWISFCWRKGI